MLLLPDSTPHSALLNQYGPWVAPQPPPLEGLEKLPSWTKLVAKAEVDRPPTSPAMRKSFFMDKPPKRNLDSLTQASRANRAHCSWTSTRPTNNGSSNKVNRQAE